MITHATIVSIAHTFSKIFKLKRLPMIYTDKYQWFDAFPTEVKNFAENAKTGGAIYGTCIVNRNVILINLEDCYKDEIGEESIIATILEEVLHMKHPTMSEFKMNQVMKKYGLEF